MRTANVGCTLGRILLLLCLTLPAAAQALAGAPKGVTVEEAGKRFDGGRKWAVIVGVNKYLDPGIHSLEYCVADARLVAETLIKHCGYEAERVLLITDDQQKDHFQPLRINLDNQIRLWFRNVQEGDTVLVFFSGHGFLDECGQGFLAPKDCLKAKLGLSAYRTDDLRDVLQQCDATQKILILDCCHAGGVKSGERPGPSSDEVGAAFRQAKGLITLASCQKQEQSREWKAQGHGLFTHFVAKGLEGEADFDRNSLVDSDELYRFVLDKVSLTAQKELNAKQTPGRCIPPETVGVFALSRLQRSPFETQPPRTITNSIGMKLVLIPAGEFQMGSLESAEELARAYKDYGSPPASSFEDEHPHHRVCITKPFYLGAHEVTRGQFRKFVEDTSYQSEAEKNPNGGHGYQKGKPWIRGSRYSWRNTGFEQTDDHPVVNVAWNDTSAFCLWLSRKEEMTYRLPTEAEWEYACRAGTTTRYYNGDDPESLAAVGNVADAVVGRHLWNWPWCIAARDGFVFTALVGRFQVNAFGLYDMHGNVWEWCADWYNEQYYAHCPSDDPVGPSSGKRRVMRGGSWSYGPQRARSADRGKFSPDDSSLVIGFRVVRNP